MNLGKISRQKKCGVGRPGSLESNDTEAFGEDLLDELVGQAMLDGVRLGKVMEVRARLLESRKRQLVLSFAQGSAGNGWDDRLGLDLYSLLGKTGAAKPVA